MVPDADFTHLNEPPPPAESRKALRNVLPSHRVEHDIHALSVCFLHDLLREVECP